MTRHPTASLREPAGELKRRLANQKFKVPFSVSEVVVDAAA